MANNRMYLKCLHCWRTFLLAKRFADGYYRNTKFDDEGFEVWLNRHDYGQCFGKGGRQGVPLLDCYTIEYESDEQVDGQHLGMSQAEAVSRALAAEHKCAELEHELKDIRLNFTMHLNQKIAEYMEETRKQFQATPEEGE